MGNLEELKILKGLLIKFQNIFTVDGYTDKILLTSTEGDKLELSLGVFVSLLIKYHEENQATLELLKRVIPEYFI